MRKSLLLAAAFALPFSAFSVPAGAQDSPEMKAERMEGVTWARVVMTKFKQGKRERALDIIKNYFAKADAMTGRDSGIHGIHLNTGEWDTIYVFPMKGGPSDMTWVTSPEDVAWMTAMIKLVGSQDKAMELINEFDTLIANQTSYVGHAHADH